MDPLKKNETKKGGNFSTFLEAGFY